MKVGSVMTLWNMNLKWIQRQGLFLTGTRILKGKAKLPFSFLCKTHSTIGRVRFAAFHGTIFWRGGRSMIDLERTGKFIARCRREKQLTQKQLAEKLHVTDRAVSKWETGVSLR